MDSTYTIDLCSLLVSSRLVKSIEENFGHDFLRVQPVQLPTFHDRKQIQLKTNPCFMAKILISVADIHMLSCSNPHFSMFFHSFLCIFCGFPWGFHGFSMVFPHVFRRSPRPTPVPFRLGGDQGAAHVGRRDLGDVDGRRVHAEACGVAKASMDVFLVIFDENMMEYHFLVGVTIVTIDMGDITHIGSVWGKIC